jgi:hypothetical protein
VLPEHGVFAFCSRLSFSRRTAKTFIGTGPVLNPLSFPIEWQQISFAFRNSFCMPDKPETPKKSITPDWLVQGALTKIGDTFDRLTGRRWQPSSSLATSGLIERLKMLLDAEVKENGNGKYVPHNIKLKMQWDKFSTDAEESLRKLEHEMLTAAVDHINDRRYYTYAPLKVEVKPDYFTSGVKLFVSFDKFDEQEREAELNVTVPAAYVAHLIPAEIKELASGTLTLKFDVGRGPIEKAVHLEEGQRVSIGRTKENAIAIDHTSVSKMHGSLLLSSEGKLKVADTGSTNGTFLNGERIAYGKAIEILAGDKLMFGAIDVETAFTPTTHPVEQVSATARTEAYTVGDMQFMKKTEVIAPAVNTATTQTESDGSKSQASPKAPGSDD